MTPPLTVTLAAGCAACICQTAHPKRQGHLLRCSCLALYGDAWGYVHGKLNSRYRDRYGACDDSFEEEEMEQA